MEYPDCDVVFYTDDGFGDVYQVESPSGDYVFGEVVPDGKGGWIYLDVTKADDFDEADFRRTFGMTADEPLCQDPRTPEEVAAGLRARGYEVRVGWPWDTAV